MPKTGKEYEMAIRIAGIVDKSFDKSLHSVSSGISKNIREIDANIAKMDKGFDSIMETGQKCFSVIASAAGGAAAAIGGAAAASINVGSEFESAFAGVKKTVDDTEQGYARLREDILEMTRYIPAGAAEIAGVVEIAGQLGIAADSLTDFTRTMIGLGESTDMVAGGAATDLAKFANVVKMADYGEDGISNWERLGSVVVGLGNNFATTESEIVGMATRLAATGDLVGLTEAQLMGLSAAMSSVGIEEEAGSSAMSKLLKKIQVAVELNPDELKEYASVADMTGEMFADTFKKDAMEALSAFIEGLGDTERNGRSAIAILDDMGMSEIRLSNTILALSNAGGVMTDAIRTANDAWDKNTALAIEAGKRYETVESQTQLMRNAFAELGIEAYDEMRPMIVDALGEITAQTHAVRESQTIQRWIQNISKEFPTMKRKFTKYAEPVFDGFVGSGKWVIKHGNGIISVLTGIGSALAAYKTASTISHVVTGIGGFVSSLNPATAAILAGTAAIGGLGAAFAAYKQHEQALVDDSLRDHFGSISLSMQELQEVAEHIVSTESLDGVRKALDAFKELGSFSSAMEGDIAELDKMNWKISIGMELTEDEKESYKRAIDDYVQNAQDYALQSQYAVSVNLSIGLSADDLESTNVVDKVNQFYADKYSELSELGKKLNEAVTDAFNDGFLDIKKVNAIAGLQRQMAEVEQALATGEFEAKMSVLGMEYAGGGGLTADSFQNLQEETADLVKEAEEAYSEAYVKNYAAVKAAYEAGDYLDDEEYQKALDDLKSNYIENVGAMQAKAINFQIETIMNQYAGELGPAIENYMQQARDTIDSYAEYGEDGWLGSPVDMWLSMLDKLNESNLDRPTRKAISQLMEAMEPSIAELRELRQQCEDAGREVPDAVIKGLSDFALLDVLANSNSESANYVLSEQLLASGHYDDFYKGMFEKLDTLYGRENLTYLDRVTTGVSNAAAAGTASSIAAVADSVIRPVVSGTYDSTQDLIEEYYSKGFRATADLAVTLNTRYGTAWKNAGRGAAGIDHNANGGIIRNKELSWLAENGPEAVVPLDGSRRAVDLWEKTGQLLGRESILDRYGIEGGSNVEYNIEYKPTQQFYGGTPNREDIIYANRISQEDFESLMKDYLKTHGRVAY